MAKLAGLDVQVLVNSVDLSNHIDTVTLEESVADVITTSFTSDWETRIAGIKSAKFTANFHQDFAAASTEATIGVLLGSTTSVEIVPVSGTVSTTNPSYTFTILVEDWKPVDVKVGNLMASSITWPVTGAVVKATS